MNTSRPWLLMLLLLGSAVAAEPAYPLWDGAESVTDGVELLGGVAHELAKSEPALGHVISHGDKSHIVVQVRSGFRHRVDVIGSSEGYVRARVVEHVSDLRTTQPVVDRHDDQSCAPAAVGDLGALDRVEGHQRDSVFLVAAEPGQNVRGAICLAQHRRVVEHPVTADQRRLIRQRFGMRRQEIEVHSPMLSVLGN